MQRAIGKDITLIDNRPHDQHVGVNKPAVAKRYGTIPGAKSFPESWVTEDGGGKFRDVDSLAQLYEAAGIEAAGEQITFCNTAHWASLGWFVSHELLGNDRARMYDGSMAEWSADPALPVGREVSAP